MVTIEMYRYAVEVHYKDGKVDKYSQSSCLTEEQLSNQLREMYEETDNDILITKAIITKEEN